MLPARQFVSKHFDLLLAILIIASAFISLWAIFMQPLWGDEIYTIQFARNTTYTNLLTNFVNSDTGYYYFFVKFLSALTQNLILLRFFSSLLPFWAGCALIIVFVKKMVADKIQRFFILFFILFNPFLLHLTWQMRTYGVVFLFSVVAYILFLNWRKERKTIQLFYMHGALAVGSAFHQSLFIFAFFLWVYIIFYLLRISFAKMAALILFITAILAAEFKLLSPVSLVSQYGSGRWIAIPNLMNIPNVIMTSWGLDKDFYATNNGFDFVDMVFYCAVFVLSFLGIRAFKHLRRNARVVEMFFLVLLPYLFIIFISVALPHLSFRQPFAKFVPNISIFLPRVFLPYSLVLAYTLGQIVWPTNTNKTGFAKKPYTLLLCFLILVVWLVHNYQLNFRSLYSTGIVEQETNEMLVLAESRTGYKVLVWPAIFNGTSQIKFNAGFLGDFVGASVNFATTAANTQEHDSLPCSQMDKTIVYVRKDLEFKDEYPYIQKKVEECLRLERETALYKIWTSK